MFLNKNPQGGVASYIHKTVHAQACDTFKDYLFKESVWSHFTSISNEKVLIGCAMEVQTLQEKIVRDCRNY